MTLELFIMFMLPSGAALILAFVIMPLWVIAPKNQATLIFFFLSCCLFLLAEQVLRRFISEDKQPSFYEKELYVEVVIYVYFFLAALFFRAIRVKITKDFLVRFFFLLAAGLLIFFIPLFGESTYDLLTTKLTPIYLLIDPIRILIPVIWCLYEVSRQLRNAPFAPIYMARTFLIFFIFLTILYLAYLGIYLPKPELIASLQANDYLNYGITLPYKLLNLSLLLCMTVCICTFWIQNYTLTAIEEHKSSLKITTLMGEKDRLTRSLFGNSPLLAAGALSAGLSHELNQYLARIQLNSDEALSQISRPEICIESLSLSLHSISKANHEAASLVSNMKNLFKSDHNGAKLIDFDGLVVDVASNFKDRANDLQIQITLNLNAKGYFMIWDSLMRQVIANLIGNACDALHTVDRKDKSILIQSFLDKYGQYCLEVTDNGHGIDPALTENIFTVFASSKPSGNGIGLWISNHIIQRHQGVLNFRNLPNQEGVSFLITIPSAEKFQA